MRQGLYSEVVLGRNTAAGEIYCLDMKMGEGKQFNVGFRRMSGSRTEVMVYYKKQAKAVSLLS